jgi:formamidopyrimidine-DNA glycosylase
MPELPEVETTKKKLMAARLVDRRIAGIRTDYPKAFKSSFSFQKAAKDITGRKIKKIRRQGKILFIDLAGKPDERILAFHLRMSGSLLVGGKNLKEKGVHFRADLGNGRFLYFRDPRKFGVIWYFSPDEIKNFAYLRNLGQDF